jgi:solute carrier family 30 (zinc transporter), member 2
MTSRPNGVDQESHLLHQGATGGVTMRPAAVAAPAHKAEIRLLSTACCLTFVFFVVELVGGYFASSLAIMSDAAHLLSDMVGFGISLLALSISKLPASASMSFGFARAEVLGAFVSVLFIWALTIVLVLFAIYRFFVPRPVNGPLMLILGVVGLAVNILLGLLLGGHHHHGHGQSQCHSHSHSNSGIRSSTHADDMDVRGFNNGEGSQSSYGGTDNHAREDKEHRGHAHVQGDGHDHARGDCHAQLHGDGHAQVRNQDGERDRSYSHDDDLDDSHDHGHSQSGPSPAPTWRDIFLGASIESLNVRAAYLHILGDALQNVGVIVAALIISVKPSWSVIDPLCTLLFACIVIMTTRGLAVESFTIIMEGTPPSISIADVYRALVSIPGVSRVGDLHIWSLTASRHALSAVLFTSKNTGHDVLKSAQLILREGFAIHHATVQVSNCDEENCCDDSQPEGLERNCVSSLSLATFV